MVKEMWMWKKERTWCILSQKGGYLSSILLLWDDEVEDSTKWFQTKAQSQKAEKPAICGGESCTNEEDCSVGSLLSLSCPLSCCPLFGHVSIHQHSMPQRMEGRSPLCLIWTNLSHFLDLIKLKPCHCYLTKLKVTHWINIRTKHKNTNLCS